MGYQGVTDVEYWRPSFEPGPGRGGRPKVRVKRTLVDYPAPTPQVSACRLWQGAVDGDGYGVMSDRRLGKGIKKYVHRWVWEMANRKKIPAGMVIRHKCDNRVCYRLAHLEIGSVADNNRDAQERGHLGQVRCMAPSEVRAIMARKDAGELWREIAPDYPQYSMATVKRAKDYLKDLP